MKIAITGPESSGKTSLAISLANYLGVSYLPELARFALQASQGNYVHHDLLDFMRLQAEAYRRARYGDTAYLIQDSDWNVFEVWECVRFGKVSPLLATLRSECPFDHYLLCAPDLPWAYDPLRENENDRDELFEHYHRLMHTHQLPYTIISGHGQERLHQALEAIKAIQ